MVAVFTVLVSDFFCRVATYRTGIQLKSFLRVDLENAAMFTGTSWGLHHENITIGFFGQKQ